MQKKRSKTSTGNDSLGQAKLLYDKGSSEVIATPRTPDIQKEGLGIGMQGGGVLKLGMQKCARRFCGGRRDGGRHLGARRPV